jgi:uncharacterized protein YicC (UPF0701 family)
MELVYVHKLLQERGKVFSIYINTAEQTSTKVNAPIVKAYMDQLREVYAHVDETELMKMASRMPDTMKVEREEIDATEWSKYKPLLKKQFKIY